VAAKSAEAPLVPGSAKGLQLQRSDEVAERDWFMAGLVAGVVSYRRLESCPVNIAFSTLKLRSLCESQAKAEHQYGYKVAKQLRARLAELRAVDTVLELPAGRPREIAGNPHKNYAVNLADGYRLVLGANHTKVPVLESGGIDWAQVSWVMVVRIEVSNG
jgi:hypothetical protein